MYIFTLAPGFNNLLQIPRGTNKVSICKVRDDHSTDHKICMCVSFIFFLLTMYIYIYVCVCGF